MPFYKQKIRDVIESEANLEGFTDAEKTEIIDKLLENAISVVHIEILDRLNPTDRDEFYILGEKNESEKIEVFLKEKIPNLEHFIRNRVVSVVSEFNELRK
jgi:hypothetical protein